MNPLLQKAILEAVLELANIPFAPQDAAQQQALMRQIAAFADRPDGVHWMAQMAAAHWSKWLGPAELRGIYCNRYKPADGIEADCAETSGFTPADNEMAYYENKANEEQRKLLKWQHEAAPKRLQ